MGLLVSYSPSYCISCSNSSLSMCNVSKDVFAIVLITLTIASYPYIIAIVELIYGPIFYTILLNIFYWQYHHLPLFLKKRHDLLIKNTMYFLLLITGYLLFKRDGMAHPLTVNGLVLLAGCLKFMVSRNKVSPPALLRSIDKDKDYAASRFESG